MKKLICLFAFLAIICVKGLSQDVTSIYLICTSTSDENAPECIWRGTLSDNDPVYNHPSIYFMMGSKNKGYSIWFSHYSFNLTELAKTRPVRENEYQMEIVIKPRSFYNNTIKRATYFYLDEKLNSFKSAREAWDWAKMLKKSHKKIYIYDNSDYMNYDPGEGEGPNIRLIEVRVDLTNEPDNEIVIE